MSVSELLFLVSFLVIFYTYLGYGILIWFFVLIKKMATRRIYPVNNFYEPAVTLIVPCFNEADIMEAKIANCRSLNYPADKLSFIFITDGSTDDFVSVLKDHPDISALHEDQRAGKTATENRAMLFVTTPIVIFSDANTFLNSESVKNIVRHFADKHVGCVSGEKRIIADKTDSISAAGESIYWKYESILKKLDAALNCTVGAAGELVAFRSDLYKDLPEDTLLDDFMQSMQIAANGYRIAYEPEAFSLETASLNVKEELKRKRRIAAGNWQAMKRLTGILRFTKTPLLLFQYISHKVLRWSVAPFLLILIFFLNILLAINSTPVYTTLLILQAGFYLIAIAGYFLQSKKTRFKILFVPYYFCVMNYAALAGFAKFLSDTQQGTWDKAKRRT